MRAVRPLLLELSSNGATLLDNNPAAHICGGLFPKIEQETTLLTFIEEKSDRKIFFSKNSELDFF